MNYQHTFTQIMDHGDGGHGGHGGHGGGGGGGGGDDGGNHGGHGDGSMCSMNMLFNWDTENICIVFSWWHVNSIGILILSCFVVASLGILYEIIRWLSRKYDASICNATREETQDTSSEENAPLLAQTSNRVIRITFAQQLIRSLIYTVQVFFSFFIMLIFMTYNGFLMLSVSIGAGVGYLFFGKHTLSATQDLEDRLTCH